MSKAHYLALTRVSGVGGATARKLVERFGTVARAFDAEDLELATVPRVTPDVIRAMREVDLDEVESEIESLDDEGIKVLTWDDDDYPENLRSASDAPFLLYAAGRVTPEDARAVAVVGSRDASGKAVQDAEKLARGLAEAGFTIVSGLALGVDTAGHRGALQADDGRTLAVLGSGLRVIHPRENMELAEEIASRGAVLSDYRPNTPPSGQALMSRDRIVSGLSLAVIVVEAGMPSGSVDTAERGRKQGRKVLAVPGSPGTNGLIRSGAEVVDPDDIASVVALIEAVEAPLEGQLGLF
jgi:DNA processing protein